MNSSPSLAAGALVAGVATTAVAADSVAVNTLIAKVKNPDDAIRGPAWQGAAPLGALAIAPLGAVMTDPNFEIARSAKRAIEVIVRHAGRPGANAERKAVAMELMKLLQSPALPVRRHALWMLSEVGGDEAVPVMAQSLGDAEAREDARCSLERIPGQAATAALKTAFSSAPEDFKYALANSLRVRGETVTGYPSKKLVPTKQTSLAE